MADQEPRKSQATLLVEMVTASSAELFHDAENRAYATVEVKPHQRATYPIRSRGFRDWLARLFNTHQKRAPSTNGLADAANVLAGIATFDGPEYSTAVRVGSTDDAIYLDLADAASRVVEVTATGWEVRQQCDIRFVRPGAIHPLPEPDQNGGIKHLRPFLNVSDTDWILLQAFLVGCFNPRIPLPILIINGEQGSCKSTACKLLKRLVDPSKADLRQEPRDARDLMIGASNAWLLAFDNLSNIKPALSDSFCRLATGAGFATRTLHTDADEQIFEARRPVCLNGIPSLAEHADLLDRAIVIRLEPMPEADRKREQELMAEFDEARPVILGGILHAVSAALRDGPDLKLETVPRMADFAHWASAAEKWFNRPGDLKFLPCYLDNRKAATGDLLEDELIVDPLLEFVRAEDGSWFGTATELLQSLKDLAGEQVAKSKDWPKRPHELSTRLTRVATVLRATTGVDIRFERGTDRKRTRTIVVHDTKFKTDDFLRPQRPQRPVKQETLPIADAPDAIADAADAADAHLHNF